MKISALVLIIGLLVGCAGPNQAHKQVQQNNILCAIAGSLVGGATLGAVGDSGSSVAAGALVGAGLALLLCQKHNATLAPPVAVCPETPPPGALLNAHGCTFDSDDDSVVDGVDLCANTPVGVSVDPVGCPSDSDKDGVADYQDSCLETPLGEIVDAQGCPLPSQTILSLTGVNFDTNKSVLTSSAKEILEQAITLLEQTDAVIEVRVKGHADSRGSDKNNMVLSQHRADAVVAYLIEQGVDADKLVPVGMGETMPIADNNTTAGQAENRRVDFVVIQ